MSFSDPIIVTVNSVAKNLPRINQDNYGSEYFLAEATQEWGMKIRHTTYTSAAGVLTDRHNFEFTQTVYAVASTAAIVRKIYSVFEHSRSDRTADPLNTFLGFVGFMTSANLSKAINRES